MNPLFVFVAVFTVLSILRNIRKRRRRAALLRALARAVRERRREYFK
jgi:hypothetical protein